MNLKLDYVKNLNITSRFQTTMAFLTMSGVLALTGCDVVHQENTIGKRDRLVYEEESESQDSEYKVELVGSKRDESDETSGDESEEVEETSKADTIDLSFYEGFSLEEALRLGGYDSSFDARKELAESFEIDDYRATGQQDFIILEKLGAHVTKKLPSKSEIDEELATVVPEQILVEATPEIDYSHETDSSSSKKHHGSSSKPNKNPSDETSQDKDPVTPPEDNKPVIPPEENNPVTPPEETEPVLILQGTDSEFEYWVREGEDEVQKVAHQFAPAVYNGDGTDTISCENEGCNYTETRAHVHSDAPENLEYTFKSSNHDGTHTMGASYLCDSCGENVELEKQDDCNYNETYRIFSTYNSYNQHDVVNTCDVCGDEKVARGDCVKTGDLQFIKIGSYIYEYYNCELCHGYVDRKQHTDHVFGEWEIDDNRHIRYCGCIEEREEGEHVFVFDDETKVTACEVCDYSKVFDHDHAQNGMNYMDLVRGYFSDLLDYSPVLNLNSSPDDYCHSLRLRCSKCHATYRITYKHEYGADGVCTFGGCNVVNPEYSPNAIENHTDDIQVMSLQETIEEVQQVSEDDQPVELVDTLPEDAQPTESIDTLPEDAQPTESIDTTLEDDQSTESIDTTLEDAPPTESIDTNPENAQLVETTENSLDENQEIILEPLESGLEGEEIIPDAVENTLEETSEIILENLEIEPVDEDVEEEHQKVLVLQ